MFRERKSALRPGIIVGSMHFYLRYIRWIINYFPQCRWIAVNIYLAARLRAVSLLL